MTLNYWHSSTTRLKRQAGNFTKRFERLKRAFKTLSVQNVVIIRWPLWGLNVLTADTPVTRCCCTYKRIRPLSNVSTWFFKSCARSNVSHMPRSVAETRCRHMTGSARAALGVDA
jgi:hypothetical protein